MPKNKISKQKRITFVHSESESFAIECLSSLLKQKGHEVTLVFDPRLFDSSEINNSKLKKVFNVRDILIKQIIKSKPDLIGFSVFTYNYQWALNMARLIKAEINVPIIFGGPHPTLVPERVIANDCVDFVCIGEGEGTIVDLAVYLGTAKKNNIKNLWLKDNGKIIKNGPRELIKNLDTLPLPDKELFAPYQPIYNSGYSLVAGRGCPFRCTFCCSNALKQAAGGLDHYIRKRSVDHVINELIWAKKKFNPTMIAFVDDVFILDVNWLKEFVPKYIRKVGLPFFCDAHPTGVTPEIAKLLKKAGCSLLILGVQSASEKVRFEILKRPEANEQIKNTAEICRSEKLPFTIDHILNIPGETIMDLEEAVEFYNEIRPTVINTFLLTYYPKAEITQVAFKSGLLKAKDIDAIEEGKAIATYSLKLGSQKERSHRKNQKNLDQFIFWLNAIPLLPSAVVKMVIKKGCLRRNFTAPIWLITLVKFLIRIKIGRSFDTIYIFKLLFKRMFINFKLKYLLAPKGELWWQGQM